MAAELFDVWIIIIGSLLGVLLTARLGLPSAIGVLLIGALIGPHGLGLVKGTDTVALLSDFGAVLLLFFIGIEFNLDKIAKYGFRATLVFILKFGLVFLFTYLIALVMDFAFFDALMVGIVLSFSSTAIFARLMSDSIVQDREETRLMSAVLILEDILAIFILTVFSQQRLGGWSAEDVIVSTLISLLLLVCSYAVLRWVVQRLAEWLENKNTEAHLFSALSVCALLASIAVTFGLSPSVGAFLAGSVFSSVTVFHKVEGTLRQLILLFSTFFFFSVGMQVNLAFIYGALGLVAVFTLANMLFKFLSVSLSTYLLGFESRSAIFSGLLMLTTSEFGLLIASQAGPADGGNLLSLSGALMFITGLVSVVLYPREASINAKLSAWVTGSGIGSPLKNISVYMDYLIRRFEPGGAVHETVSVHGRPLLYNAAVFVTIMAGRIIARPYLREAPWLGYGVGPLDGLDLLAIGISIYPAYRMLRIAQLLLGEFTESFHRAGKNKASAQQRMLADTVFFFLFFGLSLAIPLALSALSLPRLLQAVALIPLLISFAFVWDLAQVSGILLKSLSTKFKRR